jgi:hypothetical protein
MDTELDQELLAAYEQHFARRFRQVACPRKLVPDAELMQPFPKIARIGSVTPGKQRRVCERDDGICYLCRLPVDWSSVARSPTVDHVIPQSRGGGSEISNLRLSHKQCNNLKGSIPHYRSLLQRDGWCCRRCRQPIPQDEQTWDCWTRAVVEHAYPLYSGEVYWMPQCAWSVHERCRLMWTRDGMYREGIVNQTITPLVDEGLADDLVMTPLLDDEGQELPTLDFHLSDDADQGEGWHVETCSD